MPQASLADYVEALGEAGLLTRYTDEKRVDELPSLMEANPDAAIFVEHVKDCKFLSSSTATACARCMPSRWTATRRRTRCGHPHGTPEGRRRDGQGQLGFHVAAGLQSILRIRPERMACSKPRQLNRLTTPTRWLHRFGAVLIGVGGSACSAAPAQDVFGSFVPSWLLCALIGVAAAILCRWLLGFAGLSDHLLLPPLTYVGIVVAVTMATWLLWFGR